MPTAVEQLETIVAEAARSGALTPAAIKQFDEMATRVKSLEAALAAAEKKNFDMQQRMESSQSAASTLHGQLVMLTAERDALKKQEQEFAIGKVKLMYEEQRRNDVIDLFRTVFRNVEVHRSIGRSVVIPPTPPTPSNSYGSTAHTQQVTDTETETTL